MRSVKYMALLLTALLLAGTAAASEEGGGAAALAGYCQTDQLFAFVSLEEPWGQGMTAKAQLDGKAQPFPLAENPATVEESGGAVSYLLLVDQSGSMKEGRGERTVRELVGAFAAALWDAAGDNARFAAATFSDRFQREGVDFTGDRQTFLDAVSAIDYSGQNTDLPGSVLEAMDYLEICPREPGELLNLVLVTDGLPDGEAERLELEDTVRRLEASPSVLFHCFGIGTSDGRSVAALDELSRLGRGAWTSVTVSGRRKDAEAAARETAELVNGLYSLRFSLGETQGEAVDATIYFYSNKDASAQSFVKLSGVPVLSETGAVAAVPELPETEPPQGGAPEAPDPDGTPEEDGARTPPADDSSEGGGQSAGGGSASGGGGGADDRKGLPTAAVIGIAAVALIVVAGAAFFLLRRRPRREDRETGEKIFMRLEVISGEFATKEREFYLTSELTVGKARSCDLVIRDARLAGRCARIYLADHIVWIEDVGAPEGVYLGGMRLYNANRLRSGDEISIGDTRFQLKF